MSTSLMHTLRSGIRWSLLYMGQFSIDGSVSTEISSPRFTGLSSEKIGLLDFKPCLMTALKRDIMTSEIHLSGM